MTTKLRSSAFVQRPLDPADLALVAEADATLWSDLRNAKIFLTGGTGFYGVWLVESFCAVQDRYKLGASLTILSRDPGQFLSRFPYLHGRADICFSIGDVRTFSTVGEFTHVLHCATPASSSLNMSDPIEMLSIITDGTARVLEFAKRAKVRKFLLASSGAVYGPQPLGINHISEGFLGGPDPLALHAPYGEGKRLAECQTASYGRAFGIDVKIARGFAFVGPHLPLDGTYAVGNFIRDGLEGRTIQVAGDGTPLRSYLYAADLALWLWTLLIRGRSLTAYNVGSDQSVSIRELAEAVASVCGVGVHIASQPVAGFNASSYIPDVNRAKAELGLKIQTDLITAIKKTVAWQRSCTSGDELGGRA